MLFCNVVFANNMQNPNFLFKPTGNYGVGYQDIFLVNTDICPDAFYKKNSNESDFSPNNKNYCHEVALRIYYPTKYNKGLGSKYYEPYINDTNEWLAKTYNLDQKQIDILQSTTQINTYTHQNAKPISNKKFPLIIFMPGAGTPTQAYTNIISNLVSNGYIVLGVNSLFINGAIQLANDHVVAPQAYSDVDGRRENIGDLKFVLNNIQTIKFKYGLENSIDCSRVELIGHSRGAMSIVNLLKNATDIKNIKALILLDPADKLGPANYPLPDLKISTLTIWALQLKLDWHGSSMPAKNSIVVTLKPQNAGDDYSGHNNFMDSSTLQYHPAYQMPALQKLPKLDAFALGAGDGYEISSAINDYILVFTKNYLKGDAQNQFLQCQAFKAGYLCEDQKNE